MSKKSKSRKHNRLEEKRNDWYVIWHRWYDSEPSTSDYKAHVKWEDKEPVKPKWLVEFEEELGMAGTA